jgi:hypothetical protein
MLACLKMVPIMHTACPLQGPENAQQLALKAAFASSVHFAWSTQTANSFMWIMEELDEIAGQLVATRGHSS